MNEWLNKYITIYRTTKAIIMHPYAFGDSIGDTVDDAKQGARYLSEGAIFIFTLYQTAVSGQQAADMSSKLPFAAEIFAALVVGSALLTGLFAHPFARLFGGKPKEIYGSGTCFLYWTGFCFFIMFPAIIAVIAYAPWLFESVGLTGGWAGLVLAAILFPLMAIYYVGTICNWIGRVYEIEPMMAGVAILFSYTLAMVVTGALASAVSTIGSYVS